MAKPKAILGTVVIILAILSQVLVPWILYSTYVQNAEGLVMAYGMVVMFPHVALELILLILLVTLQLMGRLNNVHWVLKALFLLTFIATLLSLLYQPG